MKILFVCMGNICRSPAAEGVLRHLLKKAQLENDVSVDSAGSIDYHAGKLPDSRMRQAADKRGLKLEHRARLIIEDDLKDFDLILVMDRENLSHVKSLDRHEKFAAKIRLFCEFCTEHKENEVPDPYYADTDGFELVLDLLEDGCAEIVRRIQNKTLLKV